MEAWKHLRAIILLPGVVTLVIPGIILWRTGMDSWGLWQSVPAIEDHPAHHRGHLHLPGAPAHDRHDPPLRDGGQGYARPVGAAAEARGTGHLLPCPQSDDVRGTLRPARGGGTRGVPAAFCWFAFAGVVYAVYIPLSEEPGLVKRFGEEYLTYKQNVPRWIPRLTPWEGDPAHRR